MNFIDRFRAAFRSHFPAAYRRTVLLAVAIGGLPTLPVDCAYLAVRWLQLKSNAGKAARPVVGQRARTVTMLVVSDLRIDPRVEREARALAKAGWAVRILFPDLTPPVSVKPLNWGPNVTFVPVARKAGRYANRFPAIFGHSFERHARRETSSVLHGHDLTTAMIALFAARSRNALCVADFHEWWSENVTVNPLSGGYAEHRGLPRALYKMAERLVLRHADAVITVNNSIARELERMIRGGKEVRVIRNIPQLSATPTREYPPLKRQLGIPDERFVVLYQGGTGPTRLLEPIIEALAYAPDVLLVIRGPSMDTSGARYRQLAEKLGVSDRLLLRPPLPSSDVVAAARGADLGVWTLPNLSRNFYLALPNKIFEYLAAGLPIAVANYPEAAAIAEGYQVGRTFDPQDPRSIAQAWRAPADDPDLWKRLAANVPAALAALNADEEWDKAVDLYEELMDQSEGAANEAPSRNQRHATSGQRLA